MKIAHRCVACDSARLRQRPAVLMPFVAARIFGWEPVDITPDWGLRDLASGRAFSVCRTMMCEACDMLFLDMRFDDEEMAALYDAYRGEAYCELRERFEPGYKARNALLLDGADYIGKVEDFIARHLPNAHPKVLDWGGDSGINTPFRSRASQLDIFEISNIPLVEGARAVTREAIVPGAYDLIVFAHVLEHVSHPRAVLKTLAETMARDALLYVELPHEDVVRHVGDAEGRLEAKRHWHEHINFFTEPALDAVFASAGLKIVERLSHGVVAGGLERQVFSIAARLA